MKFSRGYWAREYKKDSTKPASKDKLAETLAKSDVIAAIKGNELAFNALQLIQNGDLKQADILSQLAVKADPVSPKPRYTVALLKKAQHKNDLAIKELDAIHHWEGASLSTHHEVTNTLLMAGQPK